MKQHKHPEAVSEHKLRSLGQHNLKLIRQNGDKLEEALALKRQELEALKVEGHAAEHGIEVLVDAHHQILDIKINNPKLLSDPKFTSLLMEAINDGLYKVDFIKENELEAVEYYWTLELLKALDHKPHRH